MEDPFNIGVAISIKKIEDPFNIGAAVLIEKIEDSFNIAIHGQATDCLSHPPLLASKLSTLLHSSPSNHQD
jgi:hypothetical protein